jgi:cation transport regulator ChaB
LATPPGGETFPMPARDEELPSTLERSPDKVRRTYEKALDSALEEYHDEERAHRTAWAAVKHIAEKHGDHWELKDEPGPSDERAAKGGAAARRGEGETAGGVNARKSKEELYEDAREAGIEGRSDMTKDELVEALQRHSRRETDRARR